MEHREIREALVATARQMLAEGLVTLTAGNLSVRIPGQDLVAITPSGRPYQAMQPEDICIVSLDGRLIGGTLAPSSETPMHTMVLRARPDVHAVIHTHSPYALAFAVAHKPIPAISLEGLKARSVSIPVAEFGVPGTEDAGQKALEALDQMPGALAVLLANHGLLTLGRTLEEAYAVASDVETEAKVYQLALSIGTPVPLTLEQVGMIYEVYQKRKQG